MRSRQKIDNDSDRFCSPDYLFINLAVLKVRGYDENRYHSHLEVS